MRAPLYNEVHVLALDIVNASRDDEKDAAKAYFKLQRLCEQNDGGERDHPLQWEALGDFSDSFEAAMRAYDKGLACALKLGLPDYAASIKFAMAESRFEQGDVAAAKKLATEAGREAGDVGDKELKKAVTEFLAEIDQA